MTRKAAEAVFSKSGYTPSDVDVVELHDCFSANELITYEGLGLCAPGEDNRGLRDGVPIVLWMGQYLMHAQ